MSTTLTSVARPAPASASTSLAAIGERLLVAFPEHSAEDIITELVKAYDAAMYFGTDGSELMETVEIMATYAMKVRDGQVVPSERLDPERHSSPQRAA